ncbi:hypothetical protein [Methylobacterium iners]|nr:hypothetical protein [Methylobacterium iners]
MTDDIVKVRQPRITLDGQLVSYCEREALRLDALAARARWGWVARRYERKAARARAQGERSRLRETARGRGDGPDASADSFG